MKPNAEVQTIPVDYANELAMLLPHEAARELGLSVQMFRELVKSGEIRFIPWGNEKRIPRHELRHWQDKKLRECEEGRKIHPIEEYFDTNPRYQSRQSRKKKHNGR